MKIFFGDPRVRNAEGVIELVYVEAESKDQYTRDELMVKFEEAVQKRLKEQEEERKSDRA